MPIISLLPIINTAENPVDKTKITKIPSQSVTLTYTGTELIPSFNNYDPSQLIMGGVTRAMNAGIYKVAFTPTMNYCWEDGTSIAKEVSWEINKANGELTLSKESSNLDSNTPTDTIVVTRSGDGEISVTSSDSTVVTTSINNNTITISNVNEKTGHATVTVMVAESINYLAPSSKTIEVSTDFLPEKADLNSTSWSDIHKVSEAGVASSYWSVGDRKEVILNGDLFNNSKYYCYIIGFNHNGNREGLNSIHFQFGYTALTGGVQIAFEQSIFYMNTERVNSGGWNNSYMKKTICSKFKNSLPTNLLSVLKTVNKYSDNTGGGSDDPTYVTSTEETIFLLSEFELFGNRIHSNSAEQNYQMQYQYYKDGNSKIRYNNNSIKTVIAYWLRSVNCENSRTFCCVSTDGNSVSSSADAARSITPAFCV